MIHSVIFQRDFSPDHPLAHPKVSACSKEEIVASSPQCHGVQAKFHADNSVQTGTEP